ncbi:hypothetical protein STENM327S_07357 [Streptomyces tendae]
MQRPELSRRGSPRRRAGGAVRHAPARRRAGSARPTPRTGPGTSPGSCVLARVVRTPFATLITTFPRAGASSPSATRIWWSSRSRRADQRIRRWRCSLQPGPAGSTSPPSGTARRCCNARVAKRADIRLTVVGEELLAARKTAPASLGPDEVDVRFAASAESWRPAEVPPRVAEQVRAYLRAAGLAYGALDFAEDGDGTWWFLECNQSGQFGFVEVDTGQPIAGPAPSPSGWPGPAPRTRGKRTVPARRRPGEVRCAGQCGRGPGSRAVRLPAGAGGRPALGARRGAGGRATDA